MLKGATDPDAKSVYCPEWPGLADYLKDHFVGPDSIVWHNHPSGPAEMLEYTTARFFHRQAREPATIGTRPSGSARTIGEHL